MMLEKEIKKVLEGHKEVLVAYLYGSMAKGYAGKRSDIDVGLLLRKNFKAEALYPARIAREIEEKCRLSREVDVRILNGRSHRFLYQVIKGGRVILFTDEKEKVKFETSVTDRYIDFKPFYKQYDEKRRERLLECV